MKPGAHVLELGCGGGVDTGHMVDAGFDVDATDGVAAMVHEARERTELPVREMRFDALGAQRDWLALTVRKP
ncbi:MAG: class I SAM-dependent methyltransferase [Parerythrobacter sp.]